MLLFTSDNMESMLNFITKFTDVVKNHIEETSDCLGKEVVNSKASKSGICVDKIKVAYGAKFSMLGHNYNDADSKEIESFDEDVIVCQGAQGFFFVPMSSVKAMGGSVILVNSDVNRPETNGNMHTRREEVFRKFFNTKKSIKQVMPKVETAQKRSRKKKRFNIFY